MPKYDIMMTRTETSTKYLVIEADTLEEASELAEAFVNEGSEVYEDKDAVLNESSWEYDHDEIEVSSCEEAEGK